MNRLLCKLSGGHRYSAKDTVVWHDRVNREFHIEEYCTKCGKMETFTVPFDVIFEDIDTVRETVVVKME